ncbi:hypothetical protein KUTeg_020607 [Tegillarca granosa]|uniref:Uncharacterized protein n=1 Tax=Tegillarca granosa TaxID=220873 RepID=A0ABQ9EDV4_TEGGR|nr:hypothetical protein KUTeg_020607 [Tegillarca granosa]
MDSQTQSVFTLDCRTSNRRNTEIPSEEKLQDEEDRLNKSEHCIQHACLEKKCQKEEIKSNKNLTSTTYKVTYIKLSDVVVSNYSNEHYDMKFYILTIQNL